MLKNKRRVVRYVTSSDLFFFVRVLRPPFPLLTSLVHVLVSQSLQQRTEVWLYPTLKESLMGELPSKTGCFHFIHAFRTEVSVLRDVQDVLGEKKRKV